MRTIKDIDNYAGVRVFLRADFNVPVLSGAVMDDFRIASALPTIRFLKERGAKIILASHFEGKEENSLYPVFEYLQQFFPLTFEKEYLGSSAFVDTMKGGDIVLLENLRLNPGEKENNEQFAKSLASLADVYVNEAFPASHRTHASIVGVPKFIPGYAGFRFIEEATQLGGIMNPEHPFTFILGGAKFDTKLPLIEKFFSLADTVVVAGALANNFLKEKGLSIGKSLYTEGDFNLGNFLNDERLILPEDVVVERRGTSLSIPVSHIQDNDRIVDAGEHTLEKIVDAVKRSKSLLWNGPLGAYEESFTEGTLAVAKAIADSDAHSVVGGGDTIAAIAKLKLNDKFSFISTGGGAMLDFLAKGTLPGIEALS
ncbi:MAG: phosphoglycerate kinase [Patescibacteria group bacterium]|nr:phosphoglycerate kinase [bacterium]MDZ4241114.1 phosphoglycerate kinase [Patescibacteria group bacterium]